MDVYREPVPFKLMKAFLTDAKFACLFNLNLYLASSSCYSIKSFFYDESPICLPDLSPLIDVKAPVPNCVVPVTVDWPTVLMVPDFLGLKADPTGLLIFESTEFDSVKVFVI